MNYLRTPSRADQARRLPFPHCESDGDFQTRHLAVAGSLPNTNLFKCLKMRKMCDAPRFRTPAFIGRNCSGIANSSVRTSYPQLLHNQNRSRLSTPSPPPAITNPSTENAFGLHSSPGSLYRKFFEGSGSLAQNLQTLVTRP